MPSLVTPIPILLDKPRSVLLTNKAIFGAERELSKLWGKHCSLYEVLSETLGLNDMSVILWQGLLHEDPRLTLEHVQDLIDFRAIPELLTVILQAWNAATLPAEVAQDGDSADSPFASPEAIPWESLWSFARVELGCSSAEFWELTLHEVDVLAVRYRRVQSREDRRAALAAWMLANIHRDSDVQREPWSLEDVTAWIGEGTAPAKPTPPPNPVDAMKEQMLLLNGLYGGRQV